jgi:predicted Zn-dependent peptidase
LVAVCAPFALAQAAPRGVTLPPFERTVLANGAELVIVEKRDTPLVSLAIAMRGGALADAPGKEGTAALLADLLQKGAGTRNAAAFAEAVEGVGAQLTAVAGREAVAIGSSFLSKDTDLMLGLITDMLLRPMLDAAEFDKARELAVQSIAAAKDSDPSALIGDYGAAWLFGQHPYARPDGGDPASLQAIRLEDVKRYYAEQIGGDRLLIAVVGDVDKPVLQQKLDAALGSWRKATAAVPAIAPPSPVQGRRILLVDMPGATQSYFWLGNVGASRTDPARTAQSVVNTLLGGRFTSMLNTELRIKSGLSYGASSSFARYAQPGPFSIQSFTQTEKTEAALDLALATLDRLHGSGLDAASLASAKSYLLGQFPTSLETSGQLAARLTDLLLYDLGPEDVNGYASRIAAVDDAAAKATIASVFPGSANLAIVLIGDAAKTRAVAKKYGALTEMKLTDPSFRPAAHAQ